MLQRQSGLAGARSDAGAFGVRDLHVRLHRTPEGRDGRTRPRVAVVCGNPGGVPFRRHGRLDAVPFVRVRFFGVGDLRGLAARGTTGRGTVAVRALAARVLRPALPRTGDGAEPDAERLPPIDRGAKRASAP